MTTIELSKFDLDMTDQERIYIKNTSFGTDLNDPYEYRNDHSNHKHVYWIGLWFWEFRISWFHTPN